LKAVRLRLGGYALRRENLAEDLTIQGIAEGRPRLPLAVSDAASPAAASTTTAVESGCAGAGLDALPFR
jgi:hypothetical protein